MSGPGKAEAKKAETKKAEWKKAADNKATRRPVTIRKKKIVIKIAWEDELNKISNVGNVVIDRKATCTEPCESNKVSMEFMTRSKEGKKLDGNPP